MACLPYPESSAEATPAKPSLLNIQPEAGSQFRLGQNYPNPFYAETTIFFTLAAPSDVFLTLFNLAGHLVKEIHQPGLGSGPQEIILSLSELGLPRASYVYQLHVHNDAGQFTDYKLMTAAAS